MTNHDLVGVGQVRAWRRLPHWGAAIFRLRLRAVPGLPVPAGVDDGMRMVYDPAQVGSWSPEHRGSLVAHEVQHVLLDHAGRAERARSEPVRLRYERVAAVVAALFPWARDWKSLWNFAGDLEINENLRRAGFTWPADFSPLMAGDPNIDMAPGLSAEEYVAEAVRRAEEVQREAEDQDEADADGDDGQPRDGGGADPGGAGSDADQGEDEETEGGGGQLAAEDDGGADGGGGDDAGGEGQGGAPAPGVAGDPPGPGRARCGGCAGQPEEWEEEGEGPLQPPPLSTAEVELLRRRVAQDTLEAHARGVLAGGAELEWARRLLAPPVVDWRRVLQRHVREALAVSRGTDDQRPSPRSRRREVVRQLVGDEAPLGSSPVSHVPAVAFVLDTSGSMAHRDRTRRALAECLGIVRTCGGEAYGIAVDAAVHERRRVRSADDLLALNRGGGGTDMRVGLAAAAELRPRPDAVVVVTDGETPWWGPRDAPRGTVVCLVSDPGKLPAHVARVAVRAGRAEP